MDGTLGVNDKLDWLCGTQHAKFSRALADDNKFVMRGSLHNAEDSAQLTLCAAGHSEIFGHALVWQQQQLLWLGTAGVTTAVDSGPAAVGRAERGPALGLAARAAPDFPPSVQLSVSLWDPNTFRSAAASMPLIYSRKTLKTTTG